MNLRSKTLIGTAIGAGLLALSSVSASAAVACTGNVCWHTHERYAYPPEARVVIHDDDWRPTEKFVTVNTRAVAIGGAITGSNGSPHPAEAADQAASFVFKL